MHICLTCGGSFFIALVRIVTATGGLLGAQETAKYKCSNCGAMYKLGQLGGETGQAELIPISERTEKQ